MPGASEGRPVPLQSRIAVTPVFRCLLLDYQSFGLVGNLSIVLHNAKRSGHGARGAERENGRGRHSRIVIGINTRLGDGAGKRRVRLQIPVGLIIGLPDAAEVRLAANTPRPRGRAPSRGFTV